MKLLLPKLGQIANGKHEDSYELRHEDRKRRKKKMMALEAGCQQEAKIAIATKISHSAEDCSVDAATFGSTNNNNNCGNLTTTTTTSGSNNNISRSLEANSNNNNSNSSNNINTSTTTTAIARNNSSSNLKSMPRQRIPKSVQNDSCGEKTVQAVDVSKTSRSQEERFHRNFPDLASCSDDMLIRTYHCALVTDILLQGYLYITSRWFCFYSKLFGKKKLIKIPLSLVLNVSKKKTAKFIPNAVGVTTLNKEYLFGSLLSRDSTYRVMCNAWHAYKSNAKENGSSPESEMSETNEELLSLDSHNTVANQSESTSYEESFSNVEEDGVDSCDLKVGEEVPSSAEGERCRFDLEKPTRKKHKKSVYSLFEFVGYLLNMSSPSKTCMFLIVASILTAMLLVSAFILSCQLSNLEVLFARIVTKTSSPSAQQTHGSMAGMDGRSRVVRTGDYIGDDDYDDGLVSKPDPGGDGTEGNESEDCQSHKENLFLANLREISTMHHQLLHQINKILTALQRVTFNTSLSGMEPLH